MDTGTDFEIIFSSQTTDTVAEEIKSVRERIRKTNEEVSAARNNGRFDEMTTRRVVDAIDNLLNELDNLLCELK